MDIHSLPDDPLRALPHALGPEKALLSCCLQEPREFIPRALEAGIQPDRLYLPAHQILMEELIGLIDGPNEIEFVSLIQGFLDRGILDRIGGPGTLTDLYTYSPTTAHFDHHAAQIIEKHIGREIIRTCNQAIAAVYDSPGEIIETLDETEKTILSIRDQAQPGRTETMRDVVDEVLEDIRAIIEGKADQIGMPVGFETLDRKTAGLKPGDVFVVAARPSMGKTAFLMNCVEHVVFTLERPAAVFSLEMSKKQLISRLMLSRAKVNASKLREEGVDKGTLQRIQRASIDILRSKLHIDDTPGLTVTSMRAKARRLKKRHDIQFVGIDYLQLMRSASKQAQSSREREIAEISGAVKGMAKELALPVMLLAQLNRDSEKRTGKSKGVPRMADLRESGAIEQDADQIGLLYREEYFADNDEDRAAAAGRAKLILAKNRSGETGDVHLTFIKELLRFESGQPYVEQPELPKPPRKSRFS